MDPSERGSIANFYSDNLGARILLHRQLLSLINDKKTHYKDFSPVKKNQGESHLITLRLFSPQLSEHWNLKIVQSQEEIVVIYYLSSWVVTARGKRMEFKKITCVSYNVPGWSSFYSKHILGHPIMIFSCGL